jgi:CRISPR/Cas system-associated endoribonuclease Cas2
MPADSRAFAEWRIVNEKMFPRRGIVYHYIHETIKAFSGGLALSKTNIELHAAKVQKDLFDGKIKNDTEADIKCSKTKIIKKGEDMTCIADFCRYLQKKYAKYNLE